MPFHIPSLSLKRLLLVCCLVLSAYVVANKNWLNTRYPLQMDANGYYIYLPAIFIYHDLEKLGFVDKMPKQFDRTYFLYPGAQGGYMTKYTPGMALLELPFFSLGHFSATFFNFPKDGYSPPYRLFIALSTIFYTLFGLYFLGRLLENYFDSWIVYSTVLLTLFGTNLLFYSIIQAAITHNYVFFALALCLYYGDKWIREKHWYWFALSCAGVGLAALIRPTEILIGAIPFGLFIFRWKQHSYSAVFFRNGFLSLVSGAAVLLLFLFPIFVYWKFSTGNWVAYTYEQEGFYFDRPWQIWLGLFGFRKGWFIYTPLLFLSLWGLYYLWKNPHLRHIRSVFLWYLPINIYIVLSWYGWWYGGCFGLRALVPALALMAIPIACLLDTFQKSRPIILILSAGAFFILLNIFQSFQYQRQIMHMDSMTWRAYIYIFGKWKLTEEEKAHMKTLLDYADYSERGKKLSDYFY